MRKPSKVTQYIFGQIGFRGSRKTINVVGWTGSDVAKLPPGTSTIKAYDGPAELDEMSMPVSDVIAAGYSIDDIAQAVKETDKNDPCIVVSRLRKLTPEELATHRKGYISAEVAEQYWPAEQICRFPVDSADIRAGDIVEVHYLQIG